MLQNGRSDRNRGCAERDIYFYDGNFAKLTLRPGQFVIVFPDDVHAPGLAVDEPETIRKAVFKVKLG